MRFNLEKGVFSRGGRLNRFLGAILAATAFHGADASPTATNPPPAWISRPLSLSDTLNIALTNNRTILKSRTDVQAAYGVALQTRAIVIPKLRSQANYQLIDQNSIDKYPFPGGFNLSYPDQSWGATVQLVQSVYEGGRMVSAVRAARLTKDQAILNHQAVVADTLLEVRIAYADVLLAAQQITVQEASTNLLNMEWQDARRRFDAGTVPRFNVLRAEVELANATPRVIRARNAHHIAKNNLATLLGYDVPRDIGEDIPVVLTGELKVEREPEAFPVQLPMAIALAHERRPELGALRKAEGLSKEAVTVAKAGYKPSVQIAAGYGSRNSAFSRDLTKDITGWFTTGQMAWNIFDGLLTKGRVDEAKARHEHARLDLDDAGRRVELEVRTAYSTLIEATEVLKSQMKVQEQAEESLRLAKARNEAGTGTQLDVLNAQTALTEARTTQIQAEHDYLVATARLERAIGQNPMPR
jgi:outer membrane protein TolC